MSEPPRHPKASPTEARRYGLMTVAEVAVELRLTDKAVRYLIYQGKLPAYYLAGRRLRIKRRDLEAFLATQMKPA